MRRPHIAAHSRVRRQSSTLLGYRRPGCTSVAANTSPRVLSARTWQIGVIREVVMMSWSALAEMRATITHPTLTTRPIAGGLDVIVFRLTAPVRAGAEADRH